jgi:putative inorganic carbon (HCO3(-)) transporter
MQWSDEIGAVLVGLVFALAPFVPNAAIGILLSACVAYWLLLTLSDDVAVDGAIANPSDTAAPPLTTPIHLLILLYWGITSIATALSPVKKAAFTGWTKLTLYLVLFALMARVLRSARVRSWIITIYLHAALLVSVYGLQQWFSGTTALATWVDPESPLSKTTRVYSYLGNPNLLAGYLLPAVIFSVVAIVAWKGWLPKALAVTMTLVNGACMILTFSRGGWIGLVFSMFALLLLLLYWWSLYLPRFWRTMALPIGFGTIAGVLILAVVFVAPVRDRFSSIFAGRGDSSNNFRINVWQSVIHMITDHPKDRYIPNYLVGLGPGNTVFNKIYPLYQRPRFSALSAYSIFLEVMVETGMLGLTCFLWLLLVTFNLGWRQLQRLRQQSSPEGFWLIGAIATLFGMIGHGLVDTVWYRPQVNTLWWLMIAIIASYYQRQDDTGKQESAE